MRGMLRRPLWNRPSSRKITILSARTPPGHQRPSPRTVPPRALFVSFGALGIPLLAAFLFPGWMQHDGALLVWLPALVPAFLLAYYRGWTGASLALAAGMVVLALTQVEVAVLRLATPDWGLLLGVVTVLVTVSLGAGAIAELLHRQRDLAEQYVLTDPLTGLANRRHAAIFLEAGWAMALRGGDLAVVLFDLDHLKRVNEHHGSAEGDRALRAFAEVLKGRTRRMDISARVSGERFMTVLPDCPIDRAETFAEEILTQMADVGFAWGTVTASAGVGGIEEGMGSPDILVATADRALFAAKAQGGNRVCRADEPFTPAVTSDRTRSPAVDVPRTIEGLRVLVVDDDPATLSATARVIERLGASVTSAANSRAAVEILKGEKPIDVLVTDIVMPEMSGFTLVDLMNELRPGLPVLYISGYPQEEVYWGGTPGARSAFLAKPMEIDDVRAAIRGLLTTDVAPIPEGDESLGTDGDGNVSASPGARGPVSIEEHKRERAPLPGRILIVDDDEWVVHTLQRLFQRAGYSQPLGVTDPKAVQGILEREDVDLVVLDLHMPEMDGFQVLASIQPALDPEEYLPVLVLTGDDAPELRRRALAAGAMDFLAKPFDPAEAEARVGNLLSTRFLTQRVSRHRDELEERVLERTSQLADTRTEILHRLALAAEYRDDVTGRHAERVGLLASLLASELGMGAKDVDLIRRTGPLHDIGKIGVPDAVLRKPEALTPSEFELMKSHTIIGAEILGGSRHEILQVARRIAESHHERWDGTGYPHGLVGDAAPAEARIVSVADTFDTLTHDRPYREAVAPEAAVAEVVRCSGTQFDPDVVRAFRTICDRVSPAELLGLADPIDPSRDIIRSQASLEG